MTCIDPEDVVAHVNALAADARESMTPKTCGLCRFAVAHVDALGLAEAVERIGRRHGGRGAVPYQRPARRVGTGPERTHRPTVSVGT